MKQLTHIGVDRPRPDAPDKATGRAQYIHDLERPGMLYGKVRFSDHAHARILHIDTSAAARLPGVRAVITAENTPRVRVGFLRDNVALKGGKVRQFRDEIAAVAAISPDIAEEAVRLIEVEYEPLPAVFCPEEALAPGAPLVHEELGSNLLGLKYHHESGDMDAGRRAARHTAEGSFETPRQQQSCMGTAGCLAELDLNGHLTIWQKTQIPFLAQRDFIGALAEMGLPNRNARVIVPCLGGAFGSGLDTHCYEFIAILLAWRSGKPVKILYTREEEFAFLSPRQCSRITMSQGCDDEGRLVFRHCEVLLDNGAYTSWGATFPSVMLMPATSLYRVPNVYFDAKLVYTNNTYCQAMRGYGNPELTFALESNLDELAAVAGIDPLELRLRNCNEPGETTPMGLRVTTCGLRECLLETGRRLDWAGERGQGGKKRRGVGLASLMHVGGSGRIYRSDASGISLRLDDFANVYVASGGVEMGQGLHSALSLSVAEAVGVRPEQVFITQTDTSTCPWDVGTHASRGAFVACNAVLMAAKKLREQIFAAARDLLVPELEGNLLRHRNAHPDYEPPDFDFVEAAKCAPLGLVDSRIFIEGAPKEAWLGVDLARFCRAIHFRAHGQMLTANAFYDPPSELPDWENGMGNMSATYAFGSQGVLVEVDTDTGDVRILKLVAVHDVGSVINRQTLLGQTYGGIAQGVGFALYENVQSHEGRVLNPSFRDYKIPTCCELDFPIEVAFVETNDEQGPFGAKGVGEPGLVPTAPAIANAIADAIGVRITELPITPERVLLALAKK